MASVNSVVDGDILAAYDFSSCGTIVDGDGGILAVILKAHPRLRGIVTDLPHVVDRARSRLKTEGLAERCQVVRGDFFRSVPKGSTYILKWIIHDWDDRHSEAILENCYAAMSNGGRILIIESVIQPDPATRFSKFMDLACSP